MDTDPDIPLPSIEVHDKVNATTPQSERSRNAGTTTNVSGTGTGTGRTTNTQRLESSPARAQYRTPRSRPSTPGSSSISRSPSVASARNERSSTPKLDKKRSVPNLSTPVHQPQFRRASSNLNPSTPIRIKAMDRPQMTPASVAKDYFRKELKAHSRTTSKVVVFTHDACYGHRFSRPRSTKAALGSIVERPERIHATLLGASVAYVRLGERHSDGKHAPHPGRESNAPPFALVKSTRSIPLTNPAVTAVHGTKWMESLQVMCDSAEAKLAMGQKELARPFGHTKDAKGNTMPALHSGDLYLSSESLAALQGCLGAVCDAVDTVFQPDSTASRAFVCIRPPGHHCSADLPTGFCWLNNVHVGISYAAMNHGLTHAAIIDFDLHHGDGSQTITWDHNRNANDMLNPKNAPPHKKIPIGYYSLHDINSYPCEYGDEEKVRNASTCLHTAHGQSVWNVHLESWTSLDDFWNLYQTKYKILLDKARSFLQYHSDLLRRSGIVPKAAVFLSSGFDASQWESEYMQRHQVNVPTDFYARITSDVVNLSEKSDLGVDGRIVSVLEGGYSDRALTSGVLSHLCGLTHKVEEEIRTDIQPGLGRLIDQAHVTSSPAYNPDWWHQDQLESLEAMVLGLTPPPTKPKDKSASSYSSPTHASTAKMTEVAKERKSISAQMDARLLLENAPPEPVPEVDWTTAAYQLSRLLIPTDRQTESYTHEELNAENSRARRDRQSLAGAPARDIIEDKMQLRDRKSKQANLDVMQPRAALRTSNRRTTIAAASELPDPTAQEPFRPRRRSSAASSVLSGLHGLKLEDKGELSSIGNTSTGGSAAPSKTEAALPMKRTRAPARKPASRPSSPRKAKLSAATSTRPGTVKETSTISSNSVNTDIVPTKSDDMDDLTNGMKKISIKLKLPTEEQHNANQKRAEEVSTSKPRITRKPPIPKLTKTKASVPSQTSTLASTAGAATSMTNEATALQNDTIPHISIEYNAFRPSLHSQHSSDFTRQQNVTTMSALDFLSATEADTQHKSDVFNIVPDGQDIFVPSNEQQAQQHMQLQPAGEITYPSIDANVESLSPLGEELVENVGNKGAKSIWDFPDTPQK